MNVAVWLVLSLQSAIQDHVWLVQVSVGEEAGEEQQQDQAEAGTASQGKAKGKRAAANGPAKPGHVKAGSVAGTGFV